MFSFSFLSLRSSLSSRHLPESQFDYPPKDGGGLTISGNLKSFKGPVLNCRDSTKHRALYLNELVVPEIRNNASAILQNFVSSCCEIEFVQLW